MGKILQFPVQAKEKPTPTYTCIHHVWQSWNHYGVKIPESGCKLKGGLFDCGYFDAKKCPNYSQKSEKTED